LLKRFRPAPDGATYSFAAEVARLHAAKVAGDSGRLRELFDYLADRGPDAASASQADIADAVFGQVATEGDDATARVYIHRLRKRLEDFYEREGEAERTGRLVIPAGAYALRQAAVPLPADEPVRKGWVNRLTGVLILGLVALLAAFLIGRQVAGPSAPAANSFWQPIVASDRPLVIVVGDYYMFGELNSFDPDQSRLIRDFRIDGPTDLVRAQEAEPERYERAEDVGLTYLPLSSAFALNTIAPVLAREGRVISIVPASELTAATIRDSDVVYIGLVSGMGLLEDLVFANGTIRTGETYDEFTDSVARQRYTSEEMRRLASPVYYRDYGYFTRLRGPGGGWVAVIAGSRDTALRGLAPALAAEDLAPAIDDAADAGGALEGLFQVTGQQGADLSQRLLAVRARK
jgi:hypothetical protein